MSGRDLPEQALRPASHTVLQPVHEHEFESAPGLPEPLPPGERLLWQGAPDWRDLARRAFHLRTLAVYFAAVLAARALTVASQGGSAAEAGLAALWLLPLAAAGLGLVATLAWLSARTTAYTVTDRRVVMRIGIVLSVTFNLPYRAIESAGLRTDSSGLGDIPLALAGSDRIAWLHLWPHARPWQLKRTQPMLRSLPQAEHVARLLTDAWTAARQQSGAEAGMAPGTLAARHTEAGAAAPRRNLAGGGASLAAGG